MLWIGTADRAERRAGTVRHCAKRHCAVRRSQPSPGVVLAQRTSPSTTWSVGRIPHRRATAFEAAWSGWMWAIDWYCICTRVGVIWLIFGSLSRASFPADWIWLRV